MGEEAPPYLGRQRRRDRLQQHLLLREADGEPGEDLGRRPREHQEDVRPAGDPRGREEVPGGRRRAVREHPDLVKEYFGTVIPPEDNKFAALNSSVWSGGSFVYVPAGVHVDIPLQAYFRINAQNMGQFERTLIIAEPGSYVHYVEGCTAPTYTSDSLHSAVVEIIALPGARIRYTTVQNWSTNVYNLVTKRAIAYRDATMEWVDGNLGSKLTMKYPSIYLLGERAHGEVLSFAFAGAGQHQDAGAKIIHTAPN